MIKFEANGQSLSVHLPLAVSDSIDYLSASFDMSSPDWDNTNQWLHLKDENGQTYDVEITNGYVEPGKLNLSAGRWEAWIHGTAKPSNDPRLRAAPTLRNVTSTVSFVVTKSGMLENAPLPPIAPSAAEQIAANAEYAKEQVDLLRKEWELLKPDVNAAAEHARLAKSWAVGDTGIRVGEDTDNSKYYSEQAGKYSDDAFHSAFDAAEFSNLAEISKSDAAKQAQAAAESAQSAKADSESAKADADRAEAAAIRAKENRSVFAVCYDEAASPASLPNTWYVPKEMPKPSADVGLMVDVKWTNGHTGGLGYDVSLIWGLPDGPDNETIIDKASVSDSLTGEYSIPTEGTIRYQYVEQNGRKHWQYVSGPLLPKQFSTDAAPGVADKPVHGMELEYLPGMEIYVQMDKGNSAPIMRLVPDNGPTLPVYGNGIGKATGDIPAGTILHLKNAGDHWQIINGGGGKQVYTAIITKEVGHLVCDMTASEIINADRKGIVKAEYTDDATNETRAYYYAKQMPDGQAAFSKDGYIEDGVPKQTIIYVDYAGEVTVETRESTVDGFLNEVSEHPVQNNVVTKAIRSKADKKYVDQNFANSLRGSATGKKISITDAAPATHEVVCKVHGTNILDLPSQPTNTDYAVVLQDVLKRLYPGYWRVTLFGDAGDKPSSGTSFVAFLRNAAHENVTTNLGEGIAISSESLAKASELLIYFNSQAYATVSGKSKSFKIQMEEVGSDLVGGPYTKWLDPSTVRVTTTSLDGVYSTVYSPDINGNVSGMSSMAPGMTITTDKTWPIVHVEYNRDINSVRVEDGGYYAPNLSQTAPGFFELEFHASKPDMPSVPSFPIDIPSDATGVNADTSKFPAESVEGNVQSELDYLAGQASQLNESKADKSYVDQTFANALKGNVSGPVVAVDDVSSVVHKVGCTVESTNLIPYPFLPVEAQNGVNITDNGDGTFTLSGTSSTGFAVNFYNDRFELPRGVKPSETYTLSADFSGTNSNTPSFVCNVYQENSSDYGAWLGVDTVTSMRTLPLPADATGLIIYLYVPGNATFEDFTIKAVLSAGKSKPDFTPYVPDLTAVTVSRLGKNLTEVTRADVSPGMGGIWLARGVPGNSLTISYVGNFKPTNGAIVVNITSSKTGERVGFTDGNHTGAVATTVNYDGPVDVAITNYSGNQGVMDNIQIEVGASKTKFEPPVTPKKYSPDDAGNVRNMESLSPSMTILTDTPGVTVSVEYNRDINKAFAKLEEAILSTGGNV